MGRFAWLIIFGAMVNGVAGLGLAALKLCGAIDSPWKLVLVPVWVPLAISAALGVVLAVQLARGQMRRVLDELAASILAVR